MLQVYCPSCGGAAIVESLEATGKHRCGHCMQPLAGATAEKPAARPEEKTLRPEPRLASTAAVSARRPSLAAGDALWARVRDGVDGLRGTLVAGMVLGVLLAVLLVAGVLYLATRTGNPGNALEDLLAASDAVKPGLVLVALAAGLAAIVWMVQLFALTSAPEPRVRLPARVAFAAAFAQAPLVLAGAFETGRALSVLACVTALAGMGALAAALLRLADFLGEPLRPLATAAGLTFGPAALAALGVLGLVLFRVPVDISSALWGTAIPVAALVGGAVAFGGGLLLRKALAALSDALG